MTRDMKDSGIEWIGEIPSDWSISKLKYVASIIGGNGFPEYLQGEDTDEIPFYKAGDISAAVRKISDSRTYISRIIADKHRFNLIPSGAILMPKIGEAMKKNSRALSTKICCIDNNCQAIVPSNQVEQDYCYYLLCIVDMNDFDNAGTIPSLNNSKLLNLQIPFPPKKTQHAIANYLDSKCSQIDALIANTEAQIASLGEYKKALITQAVTKGLDPDVEMKDSGIEWIGEIPSDWSISKLKYVASIIGGNGFPEYLQGEDTDEIPFYKAGDISAAVRKISDSRTYISRIIADKHRFNLIPSGAILMPKIGEAMKKNSRALSTKICCIDNNCQAIVPSNQVEQDYCYYLLCIVDMNDFDNAGTIPSLNNSKLLNLQIPFPPKKTQHAIANYLDSKCSQIDALIQTKSEILNVLQEYKKSLIFDYVTGKKEVPVSYRKDGCHE